MKTLFLSITLLLIPYINSFAQAEDIRIPALITNIFLSSVALVIFFIPRRMSPLDLRTLKSLNPSHDEPLLSWFMWLTIILVIGGICQMFLLKELIYFFVNMAVWTITLKTPLSTRTDLSAESS